MEQSKRLGRLLLPALAAALAALVTFTVLYHYNNKYTAPGAQPINGLLVLGEAELAAVPVHHLVREWECYPGVLLSPADFAGKAPESYRQYVSIGQYGGMDFGNTARPPHGSATYRLTLDLPDTPRQYSLYLPVIFSAYTLYLNDQAVLRLGQPEPSDYLPRIQSKTVTFQGSGRVQLLLAVTDQTWIYSGMVYPPALGSPEAVQQWTTVEVMLRTAFVVLAALALALSLYAALRVKWRPGYAFALTAFFFCLYLLCPLLNRFWETGGLLVNALLLFSLHATLCFAVGLQCSLCGVGERLRRGALALFGLGALTALTMGLSAPVLSLKALLAFSLLTGLWKLLAVAALVSASVYGVWQEQPQAQMRLFSSLFFAFSLLFDRIYPLYEPIYGGWFPEVGGIVLVGGLTYAIWGSMSHAYRFELTYNEYMRQTARQLDMQKAHYRQLTEQMESVRLARHDLRHHMRLLRGLADKGDLPGLLEYLHQYRPPVGADAIDTFTANGAVDAILQYHAYWAKTEDIRFDVKVALPERLSLTDEELCILLGNLLENAVKSCLELPREQRHIFLRCRAEEGSFRLAVDNSFDRQRGGKTGQGLGLLSVRSVVERHGGLMHIDKETELYQISLLIPIER